MKALDEKPEDRSDNSGNKKESKEGTASYNPLPKTEIKPPTPTPPLYQNQ